MLRKTRQGDVLRTMACPVPPAEQNKLRGARRALFATQPAGPVTIWRRVSQRGSAMVARQKIYVGMIHARTTVTVTADSGHLTVATGGETIAVVPRTTTSEMSRYKVYATQKASRARKESSEAQT